MYDNYFNPPKGPSLSGPEEKTDEGHSNEEFTKNLVLEGEGILTVRRFEFFVSFLIISIMSTRRKMERHWICLGRRLHK